MWFVGAAALLLAVLVAGSLRDKAGNLPGDDRHRPFREALAKGEQRETVEQGCAACHGTPSLPLPTGHPPKEQCLVCHVSVQAH
jgi:cytochrome c553